MAVRPSVLNQYFLRSLLVSVAFTFIHWFAFVAPLKTWYPTFHPILQLLLQLLDLALYPTLFFLLVLGVVMAIFRRGHRSASIPFLLIVVFSLSGFALFASYKTRLEAAAGISANARPLIEAIRTYERENSHAPASLDLLIPRYLSTIPETGYGQFPEFNYIRCERDSWCGENSWALTVEVSIGFLNWDQVVYFPNTKYPSEGFGGRLLPIADWAYVIE